MGQRTAPDAGRAHDSGLRLGARLVGENEEVVQDLLGQFVVVEQRSDRVGHHEFVGLFAVAHGECVVFVVFDESNDLEFQLLAVGGLDDENVPKFENAVVGCSVVLMAVAVG